MALPLFVFSQKAYEAIYYTGKTQTDFLKFTLANGYTAASKIIITTNKTKNSATFLPEQGEADTAGKLKFYHYSTSGKKFTDYFILEGSNENYEKAPLKIFGKYYYKGRAYPIALKKK